MTTNDPDGLLKVKAGTPAPQLAQAISHKVEDDGEVHLRAIGAGAVSQTNKALAIARGIIAQRGGDLWYCTGFTNVEGRDGGEISALIFRAKCL